MMTFSCLPCTVCLGFVFIPVSLSAYGYSGRCFDSVPNIEALSLIRASESDETWEYKSVISGTSDVSCAEHVAESVNENEDD
jgi:hypothetical protein